MKKLILPLCTLFLLSPVYAQQQEMKFDHAIKVEVTDTDETIISKAAHVVPTPNQLAALQNEFIAFIHFGPNTYTRIEWGNGMEDPKVFDLKKLDTDQWCDVIKDLSASCRKYGLKLGVYLSPADLYLFK